MPLFVMHFPNSGKAEFEANFPVTKLNLDFKGKFYCMHCGHKLSMFISL